MKKKILLTSAAVIALCLCLIAGSTFALFTAQTKVNIAVTAGNLDVTAYTLQDSLGTRSLGETVFVDEDTFANGGKVWLNNEGVLNISRMTPGDAVKFEVKVTNTGDVNVVYKVNWNIESTSANKYGNHVDWNNVLKVSVVGAKGADGSDGVAFEGDKEYQALGTPGSSTTFEVIVEFVNGTPDYDNMYQGAGAQIQFVVETVQQNGVDTNGDLILPTNP